MSKRIIKNLIVACGCWNETLEEWVNKCGTKECPLLNGTIEGTHVNGCHLDSFTSGYDEETEK